MLQSALEKLLDYLLKFPAAGDTVVRCLLRDLQDEVMLTRHKASKSDHRMAVESRSCPNRESAYPKIFLEEADWNTLISALLIIRRLQVVVHKSGAVPTDHPFRKELRELAMNLDYSVLDFVQSFPEEKDKELVHGSEQSSPRSGAGTCEHSSDGPSAANEQT